MPRARNGARRRQREADAAVRRMSALLERHTLTGRIPGPVPNAAGRVIRQSTQQRAA